MLFSLKLQYLAVSFLGIPDVKVGGGCGIGSRREHTTQLNKA